MTHTLTKSVSNEIKNALTPTHTSEIWLAESIYSCILFFAFVLLNCCIFYAVHICMSPGMQHSVIQISQPYGLGLNETILPQYLQKLGYATHAVGKVSGVLVFVVHILHDDLNVEKLTMSKGPEEF